MLIKYIFNMTGLKTKTRLLKWSKHLDCNILVLLRKICNKDKFKTKYIGHDNQLVKHYLLFCSYTKITVSHTNNWFPITTFSVELIYHKTQTCIYEH